MANNKTDLGENDILKYLFNNTTISGLSTAWQIALFSAYSSTESQTFTELTYAGATPYARIQKTRTDATHWTVSGNQASNASLITFGQNLDTSQTASHSGLCYSGTEGTGDVFAAGALTASLVITASPPITPEFAIGGFVVTEE